MPDLPANRSLQPEIGHMDFLPVFDAFDEGVIVTDTDGRILFYNESQAAIDDLRPGNVIGKQIAEVYQLDWHDSMIFRCMEANAPILGRLFFYRTCKGKLANTIHSVFPLHVNHALVGAICFVKNYNLLEKVLSGVSSLSPPAHPEMANGTRYRFTDIVGADERFLQALTMARLAAESRSPVMLFGETGSGKEMFAQGIHNYSPRKEKPFVGINCAAIPDTLLEGMLFGTVKGAFTGAMDKMGLFEQANGGTLFLDEINSMPIALQAKLLRVLQEKKIRRVGASGEVPIAVKIISSVNIPAHQAIRERQLRMDLFYRLAVVYIAIPPLRDQPAGVDTLTRHFIYKNNLALNKKVQGVSEPVMDFFRSYHWPGNVRELEHLIEGAMNTIGPDTILRTAHLPPHLLLHQIRDEDPPLHVLPLDGSANKMAGATGRSGVGLTAPGSGVRDLRLQRQGQEAKLIDDALTAAGGNVSQAARMLNVSRQLVHYKMRKYGLVRDRYRGKNRTPR
ncbi:sigma-54-dependent Fis family transcriptional regulator [Desulfosarcina alkanivorans]|uniref:Sigma-54-dependent Fis family transcriptional regulator n=1 Tax=Desulfosarcina alkanivorans TaxID=571177 RepID=A0A5K7YP27_9BACT|nr:sigma 54-interacting transcriptional regulator [Desulfosarcina alkanivorans]BBO70548.1 sigma-54-dependent Fis family transcriptional regulator [Desulfosarcina alkanivorans]